MALARIDEDVDGVTSLVSREPSLDLRTNPFPPVSRLPAEILENIFIHNAHDSYVRGTFDTPNPATPSLVNVSYVCRHWRDIALNCQTLWTYIPTTSPRWTQELLARSQKAPLKIWIETGGIDRLVAHVVSIAEQLMNHSQRIQELHLDFLNVDEERGTQILSKFLSSPLPCLQHAEISYLTSEEESLFPFEGNTPALRTLTLEYCWNSWNSSSPPPQLSALTNLHLHSPNITMAQFFDMLYCMPHLVQLSVHDPHPGFLEELPIGEFINLSRLSDISIRAPIETVYTLLSFVDIPLTTKVKLGCEIIKRYTSDDLTRLTSLLAQRINPPHDAALAIQKFYSMAIGDDATLAFSTSEHGCSSCESEENTRLLVYFLFDAAFVIPDVILSHICRTIPLTGIQSVHFVEPTSLLHFWRNMLVSFPNVRHIKISGCYMPNIASMLSFSSHNSSGGEGAPDYGDQNGIFGFVEEDQKEISLPALEELELHVVTFSRAGLRSDLDTLCEAISTRKETQCGLTLKECRMASRGGLDALELVGRWEDSQFKVTHLGQIATAILGGLATLVASFLARVRGSGEPELSTIRKKDLDQYRQFFSHLEVNSPIADRTTSTSVQCSW